MRRATNIFLASLGLCLVLAGGGLGSYYGSLWIFRTIGWSLDNPISEMGVLSVAIVVIALIFCLVGALIGWLAFPVASRPFIRPETYWAWLAPQRGIKIPIVDDLFLFVSRLLYGEPHA